MSVIRLALGQLLFNFLHVLIMEEHHICFGQPLAVNVAKNKVCSQSSTYSELENYARAAANGDTDPGFPQNCMQTEYGDHVPFWQVDLRGKYPVSDITLWARDTDVYRKRLYPFVITVDEQQCVWVASDPGTRQLNVSCEQPIYGQVLRLTRGYKYRDHTINMCEFQVWVCPKGSYGKYCDKQCENNRTLCSTNVCFRETGYCVDCTYGFWGDHCQYLCSENCPNTSCDRTTGNCVVNVALNSRNTYTQSSYDLDFATHLARNAANGNSSGMYMDYNCIVAAAGSAMATWWQVVLDKAYVLRNMTVWARNSYVDHLYPFTIDVDRTTCITVSESPGTRRIDVRCSEPIFGRTVRITKGAKSRNQPFSMCEFQVWVHSGLVRCPAGKYGHLCDKDCSAHCGPLNGTVPCYQTTGHCFFECSDGHYGDRCEEDCSDNCDTPECDKTSGNCTCKAGYQPPLCKQECNDGQYGHNCGLKCSANCTDVCDSVAGNCTCNLGFMPPLCDQELIMKDNAKSLTWPIVGAASGGGLLLAGIVTVIVCWRRRRQAKRSNNGGQIVSSAFELSPPFAKDLTKGSVDATEETSSTHGTVGGWAVPEESGENYYEPFYVSQNYDAVHHVYTDMKSLPRNQN